VTALARLDDTATRERLLTNSAVGGELDPDRRQ
jgi:hypothetical protein